MFEVMVLGLRALTSGNAKETALQVLEGRV
jgi:hypothetical protein